MTHLFQKYYKAIILQAEDKLQKLKQIFMKCTKGNDKAQARWQKNFAKKKVSVYQAEKKKVLTLPLEKFEKSPDRYIKFAEKFLPEEDDENLDDADVDKVVGAAEKKIDTVISGGSDHLAHDLAKVVTAAKKQSPEAAKEVKKEVIRAVSDKKHNIKFGCLMPDEKQSKSDYEKRLKEVNEKHFVNFDVMSLYSKEGREQYISFNNAFNHNFNETSDPYLKRLQANSESDKGEDKSDKSDKSGKSSKYEIIFKNMEDDMIQKRIIKIFRDNFKNNFKFLFDDPDFCVYMTYDGKSSDLRNKIQNLIKNSKTIEHVDKPDLDEDSCTENKFVFD